MNKTNALQTLRTLHAKFMKLSDEGASIHTLFPLFENHSDIMTAYNIGDRKSFGDNEEMAEIIADLG